MQACGQELVLGKAAEPAVTGCCAACLSSKRNHQSTFINPTSAHSKPSEVACLQAKANRGILYVDEVNLLDDGLVDVVLDSAASGINTVEREGVSIQHPAKFIMIGSGNPQVMSFSDWSVTSFCRRTGYGTESSCLTWTAMHA